MSEQIQNPTNEEQPVQPESDTGAEFDRAFDAVESEETAGAEKEDVQAAEQETPAETTTTPDEEIKPEESAKTKEAETAKPPIEEEPVPFTPEEEKNYFKAELEAMNRGVAKHQEAFEEKFGPLKSEEEVQAELEALQAEETVNQDLKEVGTVIDSKINRAVGSVKEDIEAKLAQRDAEHLARTQELMITQQHPDFNLIRNNPQDCKDWINSLSKRDGDEMEQIFLRGNPEEVSGMLTRYKEERGITNFQEHLSNNSQPDGQEAQGGDNPTKERSEKQGQLEAAEAVPSSGTSPTLPNPSNVAVDEFDLAFEHEAEKHPN